MALCSKGRNAISLCLRKGEMPLPQYLDLARVRWRTEHRMARLAISRILYHHKRLVQQKRADTEQLHIGSYAFGGKIFYCLCDKNGVVMPYPCRVMRKNRQGPFCF